VRTEANALIGTFNLGAKYSLEGEVQDETQLELTVDEKYILNNAFLNLANGEETLNGPAVADAITDLELTDNNIIYKILKSIDFNAHGEMNFDTFVAVVSKSMKD